MHITHAIFKKSRGGSERAFIDYCRLCLDAGHTVSAIVHPQCKMLGDLEALGIPYKFVRYIGGWAPFSRHKARKVLLELQPDIIVSHGSKPAELLAGLAPNIPMVGVAHVYKNVDKLAQKTLPIITLTKDMENYARSKGVPENHIYRLSNVIYLPEDEGAHRADFHTPVRIGSMGRFAYSKGFDVLIDALHILRKKGIDFHCDIAGVGHRKKELLKQIKKHHLEEKITIHDWVQDIGSYLKEMDIFCFPSRHEPFGLALLEAYARGLPIVSANAEGPSEIIDDGMDGLLTQKGNPVSLSEGLERLIQEPKYAKGLGKNAREAFKKRFHPKVASKELNNILKSVRQNWEANAQ